MKKKEINYQLLIRRICLIVLDIICIIAASILALLTRFEFDFSQIPKEFLKVIYKYGPFTIVITLIIFSLFRIYSSLWEYAGIEEVFSLIAACLVAAVLKVGYILICKVIVMIIFAVLAIQYWVGEDIRKAEEEKRGTWLFTLRFIGLTVLTMLAANIPGQVQQDQYLYLTKEDTEQLEKVLLREATADSERCIQWYEKQMLGIRNNKALGNPAMQTEDERRYKNRIDGKEVYRDPDTCTLRVKELKDGSTKDSVLINGPMGEIIAMWERIFYIDMEDHNVLKSVTYDGRKRKTWTKDPVKQFAVIGGYVICCTEDEKLIRCDMSTGKRKELADHIQYFFAGAKLYAQKGSKIVPVSYDGKGIRVFKKDVVMMDKKEGKIYYRRMDRKKEQMYVCDVDGGMEKMVGSRD